MAIDAASKTLAEVQGACTKEQYGRRVHGESNCAGANATAKAITFDFVRHVRFESLSPECGALHNCVVARYSELIITISFDGELQSTIESRSSANSVDVFPKREEIHGTSCADFYDGYLKPTVWIVTETARMLPAKLILILSLYVTPMVITYGLYLRFRKRRQRADLALLEESMKNGMGEPMGLHPVFDTSRCVACGSCAKACPEAGAIGLINGAPQLINPAYCVGHGECKVACPVSAIELVFGTPTRGMDIPEVDDQLQTNLPGLFIAGELGGQGLIRNALEQGRRAVEAVRRLDGLGKQGRLDVLIVGAGPAGFSAALTAMQHKLKYRLIEQDTLGGTVAHFPRGKIVMTAPVDLPLVGKVKFHEVSKEQLLGFWLDVQRKTGLEVNEQERVESVEHLDGGFKVRTSKGIYGTRAVILALGRRGTPRKLGVPGEEQSKVVYRLADPAQYRGKRVLVVGSGDSALEAAASLAEEPGTQVHLAVRGDSFTAARPKNHKTVQALEESGRVVVLRNTNVKEVGEEAVFVDEGGKVRELANDALIVCAGGILPTPFLKEIGIHVETKFGTA